MSEVRIKAIVTKVIEYLENDKLLTLLTEQGNILVKVRGCKSLKSKLKFCTAPLFFGEYLLSYTKGRYIVMGCDCIDSFKVIAEDIDKFYVSNIFREMAYRLGRERVEDGLLVVLVKELSELSYSNINPLLAAINGMIRIMSYAGFGINWGDCSICGNHISDYFSLESGGLVCSLHQDATSERLSESALNLIRALTFSPEDIMEIDYSIVSVKEILNVISKFFTYHTESKLKSVSQYISILI